MRLGRFLSFSALSLVLLGACSLLPSSSIRVEGAWARPGGSGQGTMGAAASAMATSAVYFTVLGSGTPDAIVGSRVDPSIAVAAEVHETKIVNGVAQMAPVPRVAVPAGGRVDFAPGGYHLMLVGLKRELKVGDRVTVTLDFEKAGSVPFDAAVREQ